MDVGKPQSRVRAVELPGRTARIYRTWEFQKDYFLFVKK